MENASRRLASLKAADETNALAAHSPSRAAIFRVHTPCGMPTRAGPYQTSAEELAAGFVAEGRRNARASGTWCAMVCVCR